MYTLNQDEIEALFQQDPTTKDKGGWQSLLITLQENCNRTTGEIQITPEAIEKIQRYAFDYGQGGWEDRLVTIFGRILGPNLGRE